MERQNKNAYTCPSKEYSLPMSTLPLLYFFEKQREREGSTNHLQHRGRVSRDKGRVEEGVYDGIPALGRADIGGEDQGPQVV